MRLGFLPGDTPSNYWCRCSVPRYRQGTRHAVIRYGALKWDENSSQPTHGPQRQYLAQPHSSTDLPCPEQLVSQIPCASAFQLKCISQQPACSRVMISKAIVAGSRLSLENVLAVQSLVCHWLATATLNTLQCQSCSLQCRHCSNGRGSPIAGANPPPWEAGARSTEWRILPSTKEFFTPLRLSYADISPYVARFTWGPVDNGSSVFQDQPPLQLTDFPVVTLVLAFHWDGWLL